MAFVPAPPPISRAEFDARYAAGARTLEELDPRFHAWLESNRRLRLFQAVTIVFGVIALIVMMIVISLAGL